MTGQGIRTIVVGFGRIADGLRHDARMAKHFTYATHAQVLNDHPAFQWLGVVDPADDARRAAAEDWKVPHVAADLDTVAKEVEPELAVIAAPPGHRSEIVQQLPSLKAVMVEKPLAGGGEEGPAFIGFCRQHNVHVQVNYWRRGDALYRELAEGGLEKMIGRPQAAFATYGNGLHNNGSHLVDFIRMLMGEVATVQTLGDVRLVDGAPLADDVHAPFALRMAGGALVTVQPLDFGHYREVGLDIWGETGRLALYQESLGVFHYPLADNRGLEGEKEIASDKPEVLAPTVGQALYRLYDNLAQVVAGEAEPWSPGDDALQTDLVVGAVLTSAAEGGQRLHFQ
ncbi:MAG: Gfo/Idh/MocA family protein [Rhodospirillales bacterium]